MNSSVSIEDLARHARAAAEKKAATASWAREKAKQKAAVADQAESRAKRLLGAITRGKPRPVGNNQVQITPDEQLALQLHLDINGSRRISRPRAAQAQFSHRGSLRSSRYRCSLEVTKVGFSTEDMAFFDSEQMMRIDGVSELEPKQMTEHEKGIDGCRMDADGKGIDGFSRSTLVESPLKEGQGSCHLSSEIEMELDKQENICDGYRESNIVDASVNFSCDRSSSSITLNGTNKDQKNVNNGCNGRNLVVSQERQNEIDGYREIDLDENLDRKNEREGRKNSNLVEKVPVNNNHRSCDQSSSTVTLDCIEKSEKMVTSGTSNLLEVSVEEQEYRSRNLVGKELKDKINGHTESNLVDAHVNEDNKICDQSSSINSDCAEDQNNVTIEHTDSNLLEVVVKEQGLRFTGVSSTELYSNDMEYQMGTNGCIDSNFVDIPVEEQGRSCNDIGSASVSYQRVHELNDILFLSELRVCALKGSVESQLKRCAVPDRYMKKYSRRHSISKGTKDGKESQQVRPMKKYSRRHPTLKGIKDGKQSQLVRPVTQSKEVK